MWEMGDKLILVEDDKWLRPCPFCGGKAEYGRYDISAEHYIKCLNCAIVVMFDVDLNEKDAIAHWNTRKPALVAELQEGDKMATYDERKFAEHFFDDIVAWIADNLDPEEVYQTEQLEKWAEEHGFVEEE